MELKDIRKDYLLERVGHPLNKLNKMVGDDILAPILGQQGNSFNFRRAIDRKKILLVDIGEGTIGEERSALLGSVILHKLERALFSRANSKKRPDYHIFVDEFLSLLGGVDPTSLLVGSRKYGGRITLAAQTITPFEEVKRPYGLLAKLKAAVDTMICFRVSDEDAEIFMKNFKPTVQDTSDLINLNNREFYLKTINPHGVVTVHKCKSLGMVKTDPVLAQKIIKMSESQNGSPREKVIKDLNTFMAGKSAKS